MDDGLKLQDMKVVINLVDGTVIEYTDVESIEVMPKNTNSETENSKG